MPRFSVCIPSYNNACYLDACVKSVLSQDFRDIELIVINDGSTDDTCMLLNRIASSDARVIAVNRADNRGCTARALRVLSLLLATTPCFLIQMMNSFLAFLRSWIPPFGRILLICCILVSRWRTAA